MNLSDKEDQIFASMLRYNAQLELKAVCRDIALAHAIVIPTFACSKYTKHHHRTKKRAQLCGKIQWAAITLAVKCPTFSYSIGNLSERYRDWYCKFSNGDWLWLPRH